MSEIERLDNMTEQELDAELRKFGVEPEKLEQYAFQKVCVLAREQAADVKRLREQVRVLREALEPVTDEEWFNQGASRASLNAMLAARRARLLAPAKSAEERIAEILHLVSSQAAGYGPTVLAGVAAEIVATLKQEGK